MKGLEIADLFCGAGGTSTGASEAAQALGYDVRLTAINHWPVAVATHTENHPGARHLCTSIDDVNPRALYRDGELDLLWASPECTHHSVARGGRPINDQSRATAWCVVRWAEALRPGVILVENVPEFVTWGGVCNDGRPIKAQRGKTFGAFIAALESLGYRVAWRVICAADFGDPTTRSRLFIQAVRGRRRCVWPRATHGAAQARGWVPARKIIDWTIPGADIFERERGLVVKTIRRILAGFERFALRPFLLPVQSGENRVRDVERPMSTVTTEGRGNALIGAFLVEHRGTTPAQCAGSAKSADEPLSAVATSGAHHALAGAFLVQSAHGAGAEASRTRTVDQPLPAVCGNRGDWAKVASYLVQSAHGNKVGEADGDKRRVRGVDETFPGVPASLEWGKVASFLVPNFGERAGQAPRTHSVDEPAPCVTGHGAGAIASAILQQQSGGERSHAVRSVDDPAATIPTGGALGLVNYLITIDHQGGNGSCVKDADDPLSSVTSKARHSVLGAFLDPYYGTGVASSVDEPVNTVTSKERFGLARAEFVGTDGAAFRGTSYAAWKRLVLCQARKKKRMTRLFLEIEGAIYRVVITHRMLNVAELAGAQGFRREHIFTGTKTEQVKQIGNAVPRKLTRALVAAALSQSEDIEWLALRDDGEAAA